MLVLVCLVGGIYDTSMVYGAFLNFLLLFPGPPYIMVLVIVYRLLIISLSVGL